MSRPHISDQALLLLRAHQRIGRDRGQREGQLVGFWKGVATTLFVLAALCVIL